MYAVLSTNAFSCMGNVFQINFIKRPVTYMCFWNDVFKLWQMRNKLRHQLVGPHRYFWCFTICLRLSVFNLVFVSMCRKQIRCTWILIYFPLLLNQNSIHFSLWLIQSYYCLCYYTSIVINYTPLELLKCFIVLCLSANKIPQKFKKLITVFLSSLYLVVFHVLTYCKKLNTYVKISVMSNVKNKVNLWIPMLYSNIIFSVICNSNLQRHGSIYFKQSYYIHMTTLERFGRQRSVFFLIVIGVANLIYLSVTSFRLKVCTSSLVSLFRMCGKFKTSFYACLKCVFEGL